MRRTASHLALARATSVLLALLVLPSFLAGQTREERAFLRSAATHFGTEEGEVAVLARGDVAPEEIPVVLLVSTRAGVSAEAILALRRSERSWSEILRRYGLHAGQLHLPLEAIPADGPVADAYAPYRARTRDTWSVIRLPDQAVVTLVNLRFLSEYLDIPPERVASALSSEATVVEAYRRLLSRTAS
jgi:hypothetical protein